MMIGTSLQIVLGLFLPCLLTATILTDPPTGSQPRSAKQLLTVDDIDEMIEETRRCGEISALSMSIVLQNQMAVNPLAKDLIYAKAFGKKNLDTGVDASNETLFCIASITKQFTSTLLMKMLNLARKQGHK
jgi:CubicO group peptidase (beta-lactamase class C family)